VTPPTTVTSATGSPFDWLDEQAEVRQTKGLQRRLHPRPAGAAEFIDLSSNDYLGLSRDKRVIGAAAAAALRWGAGSTGSRLVSGTTELHAELERQLASFCGFQAALVFSSGYLANLGAITALAGKQSAIVADEFIHASLIDGCRLSRAEVAVAAHADVPAFGHALAARKRQRALAVTDSVFSVDGDLASLPELAETCRQHGAALLVDDAHGFGVLGEGGRGGVQAAGLAGAEDVVATVTLSKSLGAQGGAVLGPRRVINHLVNTARAFLFDTGLAPGSAAAALAAVGVLREEGDRPARALGVATDLSARLREAGLRACVPDAAVVSVRAPSTEAAVTWSQRCRASGIAVGCFRPPSVPDAESRLRLAVRADLTEAELDKAIEVLITTAP